MPPALLPLTTAVSAIVLVLGLEGVEVTVSSAAIAREVAPGGVQVVVVVPVLAVTVEVNVPVVTPGSSLVAVKGPTEVGDDGMSKLTPDGGGDPGMEMGPHETAGEIVLGVAFTALTSGVVVPDIEVTPKLTNSSATLWGIVTCAWKFVTLKVWWAAIDVGIEPVTVMSIGKFELGGTGQL